MPYQPTKYFVMIGDEQRGPYEVRQLADEGVRPETYVWCKTMDDWAPASAVPEIRRYFQSRIQAQQSKEERERQDKATREELEQEELISKFPPMAQNLIRKSGMKLRKEDVPGNHGEAPNPILPILLFILFFVLIIVGFLMK